MILHIIMVWSLSYRNLVHGQFTLFTYMLSGWKVRVRLDQVENSQVVSDGRTDGRTHHSRALYIINYIVNSDACVDAHLKTKLVYYLVYIYRLLRNCILSGCHFGTGIIIRHNVKSWLLCVIYWPFHMKIILPTGEINFLQEIFKNPKGFSRIIFRIKQKVFLQEFYSNKYFFL